MTVIEKSSFAFHTQSEPVFASFMHPFELEFFFVPKEKVKQVKVTSTMEVESPFRPRAIRFSSFTLKHFQAFSKASDWWSFGLLLLTVESSKQNGLLIENFTITLARARCGRFTPFFASYPNQWRYYLHPTTFTSPSNYESEKHEGPDGAHKRFTNQIENLT